MLVKRGVGTENLDISREIPRFGAVLFQLARFCDLRKEELYPKQVNIREILYVEREIEIMAVTCRHIRTRILEKRFLVGLGVIYQYIIHIFIYIYIYSISMILSEPFSTMWLMQNYA